MDHRRISPFPPKNKTRPKARFVFHATVDQRITAMVVR
jgi:hypothetical protein